ncbi:MAG: hypothetical protein IK127_00960 [Clostridia bacterium]|nr:hypothetical protein [Clostridia bacterium]
MEILHKLFENSGKKIQKWALIFFVAASVLDLAGTVTAGIILLGAGWGILAGIASGAVLVFFNFLTTLFIVGFGKCVEDHERNLSKDREQAMLNPSKTVHQTGAPASGVNAGNSTNPNRNMEPKLPDKSTQTIWMAPAPKISETKPVAKYPVTDMWVCQKCGQTTKIQQSFFTTTASNWICSHCGTSNPFHTSSGSKSEEELS